MMKNQATHTSGWLAVVMALSILASILQPAYAIAPDEPQVSPEVISSPPGTLLGAEPYTNGIPENAQAWRILYSTTRDDRTPTASTGIVVAPKTPATAPAPVIAWAHGTTGYAADCAPSLLDRSLETGAMFILPDVIEQGWVLVATDYIGLGTPGPHPYLVGDQEGRSVLDAVRAARQLESLNLGNDTVVWGHSQGGHAALWSAEIAPEYAPDAGVIGVAALAPATDLPALITSLADNPFGAIFSSFILAAYSETYPDVTFDDPLEPGTADIMRDLADRCLADPGTLLSLVSTFILPSPVWIDDPLAGPIGQRLRENIPDGSIGVPLLVAQGLDDTTIPPTVQREWIEQRCAMGATLDYRTYDGLEHITLVEADSPLIPELIAWTADRFAGLDAPSTCKPSP